MTDPDMADTARDQAFEANGNLLPELPQGHDLALYFDTVVGKWFAVLDKSRSTEAVSSEWKKRGCGPNIDPPPHPCLVTGMRS
jgi:hypothetical protein